MSSESTPERILSTALRLFNCNGVDRVPIYKIASDLGISPGNLTYHFARKQDILYSLIDRLEAEAAEVLASPRNASSKEFALYMVNLFSLMWRYHFFFESLTYFTVTDARIAESYQRIMKTAIKGSIQRIENAIACGDIPPIVAPNSPQILCENMWAVWVNRLGVARSGFDEVGERASAIYDCCIHHISLIQPYASVTYISKLHDAIRDILDAEADALAIVT
ncbi:TetR/AcrR family transcriptional regulator [Rhizorhapis suberifaciens]|uniref:AcrR family transcriptional regulator n=1 Tax=Rhizorhapis suberifaciens TaxID=13656 RepID=A0A840HZ87_9SPHN|nr:TetR/AcrR family transcriptional regulator [Rhizorhapis suberifaciens]MBB4642828.1 AcrR family transcriptional regulator [Rhizorhapis suberifaciens]